MRLVTVTGVWLSEQKDRRFLYCADVRTVISFLTTIKMQIVVRVTAAHPTGVRRRAGYVFGKKPSVVEVTKEEKKIIEDDKFLVLVTKGLAYKDGLKNKNRTNKSKAKARANENDDGDQGENEKDEAKLMQKNKKELVEILDALGQKEGEDFNKDATKADLVQLILSV